MIEPLLSDDAFLADVEGVDRDSELLHLWWLGQSGYLLQWKQTRILIDPYLSDSLTRKYSGTEKPHVRMTRRVVDPSRLRQIDIITASHQHTDHLDAETLQAVRASHAEENKPKLPIFVAPRAIQKLAQERWGGQVDVLLSDGERWSSKDISIEAIVAAHDRVERTEGGCSVFLGYVFRLGPHAIYHSGDTVVFDGMVNLLKPFRVDLAILPINGKVGNMNGTDAARLAKEIGAKRVLPCHYEMFEFNTADPDELFVPECRRMGQAYSVLQAGGRLTLSRGGVAQ